MTKLSTVTPFLSMKDFALEIESRVADHDGSYIDAVITIFSEYSLEIENAPKYLSRPIIEKIRAEAESRNLIHQHGASLEFE
jgi:hypothetical protein